MRFVPASCLKPGMLLSQDLYGFKNELLLCKGVALSDIEINRIKKLKYQGAYITDDISKEIDVPSLISTTLKNNTVRAIKDIFAQIEDDRKQQMPLILNDVKTLVNDIVSEITINENATVNMMDLKVFDDYTYYHSVNVSVLSIVVGAAEGLGKSKLYELGLGALLHDIGKVFVPKEILNKSGKLTPEEFEEIKKHSLMGNWYLREKWQVPIESNVAVLSHHEKYDGSGYPYGLKSDRISRFGKIVAVADVYDALTSDRPYRPALSPSEAMEYVMGGSGTLFDPKVVEVFAKKIVPYPVGTCVTLSNGLTAIVTGNYIRCGMRPKIMIISGPQKGVVFDLYNDMSLLNVTITGIASI